MCQFHQQCVNGAIDEENQNKRDRNSLCSGLLFIVGFVLFCDFRACKR